MNKTVKLAYLEGYMVKTSGIFATGPQRKQALIDMMSGVYTMPLPGGRKMKMHTNPLTYFGSMRKRLMPKPAAEITDTLTGLGERRGRPFSAAAIERLEAASRRDSNSASIARIEAAAADAKRRGLKFVPMNERITFGSAEEKRQFLERLGKPSGPR